jgi:hypothetical protein
MKKVEENDDLEPEYDLRELLKGSVRGKYAERAYEILAQGLAEADVEKFFALQAEALRDE